MAQNAKRHWWHNLPEAGVDADVERWDELAREEAELVARLAAVRNSLVAVDRRIGETAEKHWSKLDIEKAKDKHARGSYGRDQS